MIRIVVGSLNPIKIAAVRDVIREYQLAELPSGWEKMRQAPALPEVLGFDAESGVGHQPHGLNSIVDGAQARARFAAHAAIGEGLGIGIESGLIQAGFYDLNICACIIKLGNHSSLGFSGAWMVPDRIMYEVHANGLGLNGAAKAAGYTTDDNLKQGQGLIGLLTDGKINRQGFIEQAIRMALVHGWAQIKEGFR